MQTILDTMASRAEAECSKHLSAAQKQADEIVSEARKRADDRYQKGLDRVRTELETQRTRARQLAEAEGDKLVLAAQHAVASEAMDQARERLQRMAASPEFADMVEQLLAEAVGVAQGEIVVLAPPAHVERCKAWLANNGHAGVEVIPSEEVPDGVAIQDTGRTYRITNSLSSRYAKLEQSARKFAMAYLFGEGAAS